MDDFHSIPVIDVSILLRDGFDVSNSEVRECILGICDAFENVGFVYLTHHGVPQKTLDDFRCKSAEFFTLSTDIKLKYIRPNNDSNHGYVATEQESLNPDRMGDLKEAFNITPQQAKRWPEDVCGFKNSAMDLFNACAALSHVILRCIGHGLGIKDPDAFSKNHNYFDKPNQSTLRSLYYPELKDRVITRNQIRCGEHSDYGSITLLFQDEVGGLEVRNRKGDYIPASPIDGAVIVNIGDLMQRWTADRLVSTKHRVVNPLSSDNLGIPRQSFAFFAHPDNSHMVTCVDGSNKYQPIAAYDYLMKRFEATY